MTGVACRSSMWLMTEVGGNLITVGVGVGDDDRFVDGLQRHVGHAVGAQFRLAVHRESARSR